MKQYLYIIQKELPSVSEEDLILPIKETQIDSLDIVVIRVTLEKHFGFEVSDVAWYEYKTLSEALEYFHNNSNASTNANKIYTVETINTERIEIRMPQMANCALSESWLLRFLGDKHWYLLSKGFDKKSSEFKDANDNKLYATFVRINYSTSSLGSFQENEIVEFTSKIEGFGTNTFISSTTGKSSVNNVSATLMTTFSIRTNENNNEINKITYDIMPSTIPQLSKTPTYLNDYRLLRKGLLDEIPSLYGTFPITEEIIFSCDYDINPYYDINGVGLLYFAAYPIISDICYSKYINESKQSQHTIYRDIFYFANSDPKDKILFQLNFFNQKDGKIRTLTSLYRQTDNKLLAKIITVKQLEQ